MREVSATEFTRNFGHYLEIDQRKPVAVASHGQAAGYFVSAADFEELHASKSLRGAAGQWRN
jgi:prevent-host-death family protein